MLSIPMTSNYVIAIAYPFKLSSSSSSSSSPFRVLCQSQSKTEKVDIRKCSPFLESSLLSGNGTVTSDEWKAVPDIWRSSSDKYGDKVAVVDPYHDPPTTLTYNQLEDAILDFTEGLRTIGVRPDEKLALFADNSCRWIIADQGMMASGAVNVVRGSRSSNEELLQIYDHSESVALAVDNLEMFNRIGELFYSKASMRFIILLWGEKSSLVTEGNKEVPVFTFTEVMELGRESRSALFDSHDAKHHYVYEEIKPDDIATLIYTSGTTGNPKGVMLSHRNLLHQCYFWTGCAGFVEEYTKLVKIKSFGNVVPAEIGDRFLSMLPPWHAYERAGEYFVFSRGVEQVYTTVRNLKNDLAHYQPHYLISVPLVYETLYSGIQKQISTSSLVRKLVALTFIRVSLAYMECKRIYEKTDIAPVFLHLNKQITQNLLVVVEVNHNLKLLESLLPSLGRALSNHHPRPGSRNTLVNDKKRLNKYIDVGKCLTQHQKEPSYAYSMLEWLWARVVAAILFPIHTLAKKLVYTKIHSAIGISKAIGVKVQNGYGLTETSPVVAVRQLRYNVIGSVGHPLEHTEFKVVDPETGAVIPPGSKGILKVRGPQLMKGYYKNPSATSRAIDEDGWLDTGDIGWLAPNHSTGRSRNSGGVIVVEGRAKDTIVLSTGENVEPGELEEAAMRSSLIQQIVVIGQDKRRLGAVIVPNKDEVLRAARELSIVDSTSSDISQEKMVSLIYRELKTWTSESSFKIGPILVINDPFTIDNGLMTATMKVRRDRVVAQYKDQIENIYN
ncbi:hypothetical protein Lal_00010973 [Lupinus albus]|nr:hypothetical protein Lal_00010973 [Lupinus albus]